MVTVNKILEALTKDEILEISERYLMGWTNLQKDRKIMLRGLNKKRALHGFEPLTREQSETYRVEYVLNKYTHDEIIDGLETYLLENKMDDMRYESIYLFDCRFDKHYVKMFKKIIGGKAWNDLSERTRIDKLTETQTDRYGGVGLAGGDTLSKAQNTVQSRYGVANVMHVDSIKETLRKTNEILYGGASPFSSQAVQDKGRITFSENIIRVIDVFRRTGYLDESIFSKSKTELIIYKDLVKKFGVDDVYYQYGVYPVDLRYPYFCDFYIKSLDLFIEINGYNAHGYEWYESRSDQVEIVNRLLSKNKEYEANMVNIWTVRDAMKRAVAKSNNLNYLVFWSNRNKSTAADDYFRWVVGYNYDYDLFVKDNPGNTY